MSLLDAGYEIGAAMSQNLQPMRPVQTGREVEPANPFSRWNLVWITIGFLSFELIIFVAAGDVSLRAAVLCNLIWLTGQGFWVWSGWRKHRQWATTESNRRAAP